MNLTKLHAFFSECNQHLGYSRGDFPIAERIGSQELSLPMCPTLEEKETEIVSHELIDYLGDF